MKNVFLSFGVFCIAVMGCGPQFTRHYEDSHFTVGAQKTYSVEIVTGKKELHIEKDTVGIIVHDAGDIDVEDADLAVTAVTNDHGRERSIAYPVTERGRGFYTIESPELGRGELIRLNVVVRKGPTEDRADFSFSGGTQRDDHK